MSSTTSAASSSASISTIEEAIFSTLPGLVGLVAMGKLGPVNVSVQHALVSADTQAASAIDHLHGQLDALEASNPLITQGLACLERIAAVTGVQLPSEDAAFNAVKAAVHDVLSGLKPAP